MHQSAFFTKTNFPTNPKIQIKLRHIKQISIETFLKPLSKAGFSKRVFIEFPKTARIYDNRLSKTAYADFLSLNLV